MNQKIQISCQWWILALLFCLPGQLLYLGQWLWHPVDRIPTGFYLYDMPYYLANAREHFDGGFHWLISNPASDNYQAPRLFLYPQYLIIGGLMHCGVSPGWASFFFGLVWGVIWFRIAIELFRTFITELRDKIHWILLVLFLWGGGLHVVVGLFYWGREWMATGSIPDAGWLFVSDPAKGWWFTNLGRNLVLPLEAYYHAIFFGAIFCFLRRKIIAAMLLVFLLAISHPFSGLALILITGSWTFWEAWVAARKDVPRWCAPVLGLLLAVFLGYYLVFLNQFPDHRAAADQWRLNWGITWKQMAVAYTPMLLAALWQFRNRSAASETWSKPWNRMWLMWFLISIALVKHDLVFEKAFQPIHFTRGNIWIPLFFLGAPTWLTLLHMSCQTIRRRVAMGGLCTILLLDNATWLLARGTVMGYYPQLTQGESKLYEWLNHQSPSETLLIPPYPHIGYLAATYTPFRAYVGHEYQTPDFRAKYTALENWQRGGAMPESWRDKTLYVIFRGPLLKNAAGDNVLPEIVPRSRNPHLVYQNAEFYVLSLRPDSPPDVAGELLSPAEAKPTD